MSAFPPYRASGKSAFRRNADVVDRPVADTLNGPEAAELSTRHVICETDLRCAANNKGGDQAGLVTPF